MSTSIKIRDTTKKELERLQARLLLERGIKLSQQELIDILVKIGNRNPELLSKVSTPSKKMVDKVLRISGPWKIVTRAEELDDLIVNELMEDVSDK